MHAIGVHAYLWLHFGSYSNGYYNRFYHINIYIVGNILTYIAVVSLLAAFILNTLIKWELLEKAHIYQGSKWYIPNWFRFECIFCISFWTCMIIGIAGILVYGLGWEYLIYAAISQQITVNLIRE